MVTPRETGFRMPAEWAPHAATWLAWPSHPALWEHHLEPARAAFVQLASAIAEGEAVEILVPDEANERQAVAAITTGDVRFHRVPFGDIWLRDTAPVFVCGAASELASVRFAFNGWGGKYVLEHDDQVAQAIAAIVVSARAFALPFVLEGGAVEVDGDGSVLTTRQCLLNANRNPRMSAFEIERAVLDALGADELLWLDEGLKNDHTDGHVDTLVRFVRPGVVVAMEPRAGDDPNAEVLRAILHDVSELADARGRKLDVVRIPSPGRVTDAAGRFLPASYVNFYIANRCVVVPTYGSAYDDEAVEGIGALFPDRRTLGVDARALLTGGGAFHCITQQQPRGDLR
jgi:agmatine deiminase